MVEWSNDVSAADWIVDWPHRFPSDVAWDVGSFVPDARSASPAWRTEPGRRVKLRCADLARTAGLAGEVELAQERLDRLALVGCA